MRESTDLRNNKTHHQLWWSAWLSGWGWAIYSVQLPAPWHFKAPSFLVIMTCRHQNLDNDCQIFISEISHQHKPSFSLIYPTLCQTWCHFFACRCDIAPHRPLVCSYSSTDNRFKSSSLKKKSFLPCPGVCPHWLFLSSKGNTFLHKASFPPLALYPAVSCKIKKTLFVFKSTSAKKTMPQKETRPLIFFKISLTQYFLEIQT